ncbi:MAG: DUF494 family protein [Deltaproteobacteria bacterium]|nr:DUF494 family protein [Deltaproteobacteria bacterium]
MNKKIVEMVGLILKNLDHQVEKEKDLIDHLLLRGYSLKEIEIAFKWLAENTLARAAKTQTNSFRILTSYEKARLKPEAWGFLLKLKNFSVIDDELLEEILEQALNYGPEDDEINADQMKTIAQFKILSGRCKSNIQRSHVSVLYH